MGDKIVRLQKPDKRVKFQSFRLAEANLECLISLQEEYECSRGDIINFLIGVSGMPGVMDYLIKMAEQGKAV